MKKTIGSSVDSDLNEAVPPNQVESTAESEVVVISADEVVNFQWTNTDPNNQYNTGQKKPNKPRRMLLYIYNKKMGMNNDCVCDILFHTDKGTKSAIFSCTYIFFFLFSYFRVSSSALIFVYISYLLIKMVKLKILMSIDIWQLRSRNRLEKT